MNARAYYNEIDRHCAEWLRRLIAARLVADGDVDERDIRDVRPIDLKGYTQCHFFAGIGLWSLALRWAGWSDSREIWSGSCPCQPFSQAGRGAGFGDDRHLWPAWLWLIRQCAPVALIGEQVSGPDGETWLDAVSSDLEALRYACGALVVTSAGIGAPNIRHRLYWVARRLADADSEGRGQRWQSEGSTELPVVDGRGAQSGMGDAARERSSAGPRQPDARHEPDQSERSGDAGGMVDAESRGRGEHGLQHQAPRERQDTGQPAQSDEDAAVRMADADLVRLSGELGRPTEERREERRGQQSEPATHSSGPRGMVDAGEPGLPDTEPSDLCGSRRRGEGRAAQQPSRPPDPWGELEWIACSDGKLRPTQSGLFPLAPRRPGDVAVLRAAGNAINPHVAAEVISSWLACDEWSD